MKHMLGSVVVATVVSLVTLSAHAGVVTLTTAESAFDASTYSTYNQGWWANGQGHGYEGTHNDNYLTGFYGPEYRSFFTFNVASVIGNVTSATLRIKRGGQSSPVTLNFWDVTTSAEAVNFTEAPNSQIFADLGSGKSYGQFDVQAGNATDYLDFSLNLQAIEDLQSQSKFFTIGASLPYGGYLFAASGGNVTSLILGIESASSDVPEPTSIALFGLAMAGLAFNRRRKV